MNLYHIYLLPLAFASLSSLSTLRLDWPKPFRLFCPFLFATLLVEIFAIAWSKGLHTTSWWNFSRNNLWIYNIYLVPQYLFYIYFFSKNLRSPRFRITGFCLAILYTFFTVYNLVWQQGLFVINYMTIILANFIVILFVVLYFIQLMKAKIVLRLSRQPLFWISTGAFIFHLGCLPCFILYNYVSSMDEILATSLFRIIVILNFIMYTLYSIAFLCTKKYPMLPS